jgi:hypothetical protein
MLRHDSRLSVRTVVLGYIVNLSSRYHQIHEITHTHIILISIIKPTRCTNFSNLFLECNSTCFGQFLCPLSGVFHCTHSSGTCRTVLQTAVCKTVWHVPLLCVQWKTPDNGQRNCPKHVELHSKNEFEKLVHLVGFIIQKYYFTLIVCVYYGTMSLNILQFHAPNSLRESVTQCTILYFPQHWTSVLHLLLSLSWNESPHTSASGQSDVTSTVTSSVKWKQA